MLRFGLGSRSGGNARRCCRRRCWSCSTRGGFLFATFLGLLLRFRSALFMEPLLFLYFPLFLGLFCLLSRFLFVLSLLLYLLLLRFHLLPLLLGSFAPFLFLKRVIRSWRDGSRLRSSGYTRR